MAESGRGTIGDDSLEDWEILGSGGFGFVFKAKHKVLGIDVAIKMLNSDDSSGTLYAALCREADYMEAADQQFVPRVYGMYRGRPPMLRSSRVMQGIVMELMEGGCLQSFLETKTQSNHPPWPLAFRLVHQVALAMDFLHCKNDLVHMDLKPANVLLDADFNAKIADFGLSTVTNSVSLTKGVNKGGTLSYTPPEAFEETYHRVRSYDVYSYGILLWTILTGESPYPGVDQSLLMFHIPRGERPDLRKIDVQKADGLEELVELMQRCWDSEPNNRPLFAECVEVTRGVFSRHEEGISAACGFLMPPVPAPPGAPELTNRNAFLKLSSPLSFDPNTAKRSLILSENNRRVTWTGEVQPYADHPRRFTGHPNVLSNECLSEPRYFEVQWSGEFFGVAVSQDDINREDKDLSFFGETVQSVMLYYDDDNDDDNKHYWFNHNNITTEVSGRVLSTRGGRVGVYVDPSAGVLCFYDVSGDTMSLLHTERITFTPPLYAGLMVVTATAEVCEIW